MAQERAVSVDGAMDDLREMHVSVIDGVYPAELLARENLTLSEYILPADKEQSRSDPLQPQDISLTFYE